MLDDFLSAPIPDAEKTLFAFVQKVNAEPASIRRADVDAVRAAGWSDEAIYDAVTVCALFNFYNRWIDATGVQDLPAQMYAVSGKRIAQGGYARDDDEP